MCLAFASKENEIKKRYDDAINLLRPPDIIAALRKAGFDAGLVPYAFFKETYEGPIHEYWTERYSEDELFLANGLVYGPTN